MSQASTPQPRAATRPPRPVIAFHDVDVVVGGRTVLHKLSWELRPGEHWGIVGTNGSGKTTFLKLIAGTLSPAGHGRRRYDLGVTTGAQPDAVLAREHITLIGHELQDKYRRLNWNFTACEVVLSGIFRSDIPRREPTPGERERALALLDQLGLLTLAERPFLELSRGQQRRVLLARGLGFAPKILLLDEPAAGLDTETRRVLYDTIDRIAETTTVVFSAHEAHDLPRSINRIARLSHGRLQQATPFSWSEAQQQAETADQAADDGAARARRPVARDADRDAPPVIDVRHANVWFEDSRILTDITWQLHDDEHWLVRGRNGAGKSTFLRLLHGQFRPATGGYIRWPALGNPRSVWTLRRGVAWVSPELQAGYLYPTSVRACVASGIESSIGLMKKPSADEAAWIDTLLGEFELETLADRPVSMLSYGQMRRVLIARALVNRPRVLLLDEPWEGLDSPTMQLMHEHLARIIAHGTQLVCASHLDREIGCFTHEMEIEDGQIVRIAEKPH